MLIMVVDQIHVNKWSCGLMVKTLATHSYNCWFKYFQMLKMYTIFNCKGCCKHYKEIYAQFKHKDCNFEIFFENFNIQNKKYVKN